MNIMDIFSSLFGKTQAEPTSVLPANTSAGGMQGLFGPDKPIVDPNMPNPANPFGPRTQTELQKFQNLNNYQTPASSGGYDWKKDFKAAPMLMADGVDQSRPSAIQMALTSRYRGQ